MRAKITKRTVDEAAPAAADYWIWDTTLKGFGLRVTSAGAKVYWEQYRMGGRGSPTKRLSIGRHGSPWTAEQARGRAEEVLAEVVRGLDPVAAAQARDAKRFTVAERADRYLEQRVDMKSKPSTAKEFRRLVEKVIKPRLGTLAVADVTRGDLSALRHRLRKTPRSANQVLAVASKMFSLAGLWGFRPDGSNPCRLIERYREA